MAIVRVALPIPVPQVFDYVAADATEADVGRCVKVPFGRGDRNGLIVALGEEGEVDPARLKPVHHIQRGVPATAEAGDGMPLRQQGTAQRLAEETAAAGDEDVQALPLPSPPLRLRRKGGS